MTKSVSDNPVNAPTEITTEYFNNFYNLEISYNPSEVDAVIGYFLKRGFEKVSAINTASVLLQQAKIDELNVQQLIDTLKGVTDVQLSLIVAQILNFNREKTSVLGFRDETTKSELFNQRNVVI
jgi:exosome complex RNA-binding protein Rrp4